MLLTSSYKELLEKNKMITQTQHKPRSLEEALADLRRPEVRQSLETYVPASYEVLHESGNSYRELMQETAHALLDMRVREFNLSQPKTEFLHGLVDRVGKTPSYREPEKCKEHEEETYQFAKAYVHNNFDIAKTIEAGIEILLETSLEGLKKCCDVSRLSSLISYISPGSHAIPEVLDKVKERLGGLPRVPAVRLQTGEYISMLKKYIVEKTGKNLQDSDILTDNLANQLLPYRVLQVGGTFDNDPISRIYSEAVQEIPGLRERIVEIGRKYGVEMKIPEDKK